MLICSNFKSFYRNIKASFVEMEGGSYDQNKRKIMAFGPNCGLKMFIMLCTVKILNLLKDNFSSVKSSPALV